MAGFRTQTFKLIGVMRQLEFELASLGKPGLWLRCPGVRETASGQIGMGQAPLSLHLFL